MGKSSSAPHPATPTSVNNIPILLLEEEPDPLPKWMVYYKHVSYVLHGIHILYSWGYLFFVGYIQSEVVLHIQYEPVYQFLVYNSYSILCPVLCCLFVSILIYHIRNRIKLDDGDFFGLLGILLLLCLVNCYDAVGTYQLYADREAYLHNPRRYMEKVNPDETNELAWQYAWSTKPTCGRVHARKTFVRIENERKLKEKTEGKAPMLPQPEDDDMGQIDAWMFSGLSQSQLQAGFLQIVGAPPDPGFSGPAPKTVDERLYETLCNMTANSIEKQRHRDWMIKMQRKFKCCGPRGYSDWKNYIIDADMNKCLIPDTKDKKYYMRSCAKPFSEWLKTVFRSGMLIMFGESFFYVLTIILACFHFAAMKYDERRIVKEYSLLNLAPEKGVTIIDIKKDRDDQRGDQRGPGGLNYLDPVQTLFQQANLRVGKGRVSTAELHLPFALNKDAKAIRKLSALSHAVVALNGLTGGGGGSGKSSNHHMLR